MTRAQAFGRYELLDRVSAGGMAEVFRARDTQRGAVVALKRILPQVAEDDEFIAMLKDEARICSQLEHPHIARTLDFGHVDGEYYIAFEYVDGRDLRQIFDRAIQNGEQIPLPILLYVFARIGEGLSYAHHRKDSSGEAFSIVHRDVSPQNIVVSFGGDVKLIDFGIAKARGKMTRTQAGTIKGKFGYMSPEQVNGVDIDHRSDLFALGISMWELLTLERLFLAENELQVLDRIRNMNIVPPSQMNAQVSPELDRIVLKTLARDPQNRYRAAKDLYRDINAVPESTATREEVAQYMRSAFPELAKASPVEGRESSSRSTGAREMMNRLDAVDPLGQKATRQESFAMTATENKGASDLDVFEGLGKKPSSRSSASGPASHPTTGLTPPPPRSGPPGHSNGDMAKRTLMGIASPLGGSASGPSSQPGVPSSRPAPPPPPGRASLPHVMPPLPKTSSAPPAASTRPMPGTPKLANAGPGLDMDWDDEDEATHVFDKSDSKMQAAPAPDSLPPPSARPSVPGPPPSKAPPSKAGARTLMGVGLGQNGAGLAPPPPPPPPPSSSLRTGSAPPSQPGMRAASQTGSQAPFRSPSVPPPPPSGVGGAFARASSVPAAAPGPLPRQSGEMFGGSTAPMNMPASRPPAQQSTAPLPMPRAPAPHMPRSMEATALVRPPPASKTGLWIALAAVFFMLVAGAVFFLATPRTGRVVVNINDPKGASINHVETFVDGKKVCDTTPCAIEPLSTGPHEVKVLADGYEVPAARSISVEPRKEAQLTFALAPAAGRGGTGVRVSGTQPGMKLFIDDKELGPLPAEARDLTPGSHRIRILGSDRYQPFEKNITVAKDEMVDSGPHQLKVVKAKITVTPTAASQGAKVYIVSGADRRELPILPISVDIDTSKSWQLEATRPGFTEYKQPVSFDDGQAEKTFAIALEPRGAAIAAAPPPPAPAPQPVAVQPAAPAPQPVAAPKPAPPQPKAAPAPDPTPDPPAAVAAGGDSFLDINSIPVSNVLLDGKPIGSTPKLHVQVVPGPHTVTFIHSEHGRKTVQVNVSAGETKKAIAKLKPE